MPRALSFRVSVFARYPRCVGRVEVGGPGAASRDGRRCCGRSGNVIVATVTNPNNHRLNGLDKRYITARRAAGFL